MTALNPGVVVFTGDRAKLSSFYQAVAGLSLRVEDDRVTVLSSEICDLVLHDLPGEPPIESPLRIRSDTWIKPFFIVPSLADARARAAANGGGLEPVEKEWSWRGFRACEASVVLSAAKDLVGMPKRLGYSEGTAIRGCAS